MNLKKTLQTHVLLMILFLATIGTPTLAQDLVVIDSDYASKSQVLAAIPSHTPMLEIEKGANPRKSICKK